LLPHAPNFTPVIAVSLFAGFYFSKKIALVFPLIIMVASDIFIGYYETNLMIAVYFSIGIAVLLGVSMGKKSKWPLIMKNTLSSAVLFFILTNFAVWAFTPWYPKTLSGLFECYFLAIPFFRGTLFSTLFYSGLLFGGYKLWVEGSVFKLSFLRQKLFERNS